MTLQGAKILLIEDEPLIALDVIETLHAAGATVEGPVRSRADALRLIDSAAQGEGWDAVVLDYSLTDGTTEPVAAGLKQQEIPFILHSGLSEKLRPFARRLDVQLIAKPAPEEVLIQAIHDAMD
ncbi:hypothetical protein ILP92_04630 [Maribius pontilimi]|uniref:Response regulator receiver domain-containing protein n=1 Tax=Palleronia pontilimi TaxID=1964209 RepID=A0A934M915_9RHOB|nr:hypothetical protein [Palleronia pontilimi]MBJ3762032.1 hypothetical protein [Palleronia pontilimi]